MKGALHVLPKIVLNLHRMIDFPGTLITYVLPKIVLNLHRMIDFPGTLVAYVKTDHIYKLYSRGLKLLMSQSRDFPISKLLYLS